MPQLMGRALQAIFQQGHKQIFAQLMGEGRRTMPARSLRVWIVGVGLGLRTGCTSRCAPEFKEGHTSCPCLVVGSVGVPG